MDIMLSKNDVKCTVFKISDVQRLFIFTSMINLNEYNFFVQSSLQYIAE